MVTEYFAVKFSGIYTDNRGSQQQVVLVNAYYAEKQPNYSWSFTEDFQEAHLYKTKKAAHNRLEHASLTTSYRDLASEIVSVYVNNSNSLTPPVLLPPVSSYMVKWDPRHVLTITLQATEFDDAGNGTSWALRRNDGTAMDKTDGDFGYEPRPSSRTDEYLADHRFATVEEALSAYNKYHGKDNTLELR